MTAHAASPATPDRVPTSGLPAGAIAWALFEGGRNPYIVLVVIYIFMPYVATVMVGDPVAGQHLIAGWNQYFGWIVLFTAPLLGGSLDKLGPRKPALGVIVGLMVPMIAALWWARPDGSGLSVGGTMFLGLAVLVLFAYTEILHNSLLVRAAGAGGVHRASGLALMIGNLVSVAALAFCGWAFALPGKVHWPWVPQAPLFGLNVAMHEPERIVAPIAAVLLLLGVLPLLFFTPDVPRTGTPLRRVVAGGVREIVAMVRTVGRYREALKFLAARMLFVDGMSAFLLYSGIYAMGVMKWDALEMFAYGLVLSLIGALGGVIGPLLDAAVGPRRALRIEIAAVFLGVLLMLGMAPDRICYFWPLDTEPGHGLWSGPILGHLPDQIFLAIGAISSAFVCAHFASSRTMLTRITPPDQAGAFFGVYAMAGVATGWLAPMLVAFGTSWSASQQGGFAAILLLLGAGWIGMGFVKGGHSTEDRYRA